MNSTLLEAVSPILNAKTAKITMDISAASTEGELQVVIKPVIGPVSDKAPEELKALCGALGQHIKVVGEPEAIEKLLADRVNEQAPKRNQWANRAAELDAAIAGAAAKDASKPAATSTTKDESKSGPLVDNDDQNDTEEEQPEFGL
ncbi:hypothetical protein [Marinobacter salarius]|uniref:PRTRC system protein E n=1 Tax=Marinobacter salarius TaxID=1420917 RepID=A0A1W6KFF9_9GAMM|nr:hypothetical protein [Marinobacter salarius]ARM86156.1 hypothetical protein MARSALSMR5_04136 [Marinobacter salarius]